MTYFADLTPHTYVQAPSRWEVLNVGWLDGSHEFPRGETSVAFRSKLLELCQNPIFLHRGFHDCEVCCDRSEETRGNGQIRVLGSEGQCFAAPTLIGHYVVAHGYRPPAAFVEAVLAGSSVRETDEQAPNSRLHRT